MEAIAHDTCMPCLEGAAEHHDWHPTRGQLLKIGADLTRRVREREAVEVRQMPDTELVAYGIRMRRLLASAADDRWPDFLVALIGEWVQGAEKEWRWRERAARLGADPVVRSGGTWPERVDRIKRAADLWMLIGGESVGGKMHRLGKYTVCCPFHDDRHPSLDIDVDQGLWVCRACGIGGDAIRYAELRYGMTFAEAVRHLEGRCGLRPPEPTIRGVSIVVPDDGGA